MAEIGSISSSSPAQAFQRPNNAGGGSGGQDSGGSSPVEDSVQISSAGRDQSSVQSEAVSEGASPTVDQRIEANADPARNSAANQDIETEVSDIQEANTENSAAAPEQNVSTLSREQAEQNSSGASSSQSNAVEQRGQSVDQLA